MKSTSGPAWEQDVMLKNCLRWKKHAAKLSASKLTTKFVPGSCLSAYCPTPFSLVNKHTPFSLVNKAFQHTAQHPGDTSNKNNNNNTNNKFNNKFVPGSCISAYCPSRMLPEVNSIKKNHQHWKKHLRIISPLFPPPPLVTARAGCGLKESEGESGGGGFILIQRSHQKCWKVRAVA